MFPPCWAESRPAVSRAPRALAAILLLCACHGAAQPPAGRAHFTATAWPAADRLFHQDPRWLGADAAFSVDLGGERVLWLFGDTFLATGERKLRSEACMVRNTIAVQHGLDPSRASLHFCWQPGPKSWLPEQGDRWFWPLHGVRLPGGPLVLFFSRVRATPGQGLGFTADGWTALSIENPDDEPERWSPRTLALPSLPAGLVLAQGLFLQGDYAFGLAIREPGDHAGYALRIPIDALAHGELAALELWNGAWELPTERMELHPVLADAGPEFSLHFDARLQCFVHVHSLGFGATTLAIATAPLLIGPWSQPVEVFRPPESSRAGAFVYAGKAHPELSGADLVATYAANSFDFEELVRDTSLYYPRFVRVSLARRGVVR